MDKTDEKQIFICPISDARFEVSINDGSQTQKIDKFGNLIQDFTITSLDGEDG